MESDTSSSVGKKIFAFIKANILVSGLFFIGLIVLGVGLIQYFSQSSQEIEFVSSEDAKGADNSEIFVDVSGEVQKPGVYKLSPNSRTQDALIAAGGFTADANREYVSKVMNLASPLKDGMKIYIPSKRENSLSLSDVDSETSTFDSLISINSASQKELESLPGIGPVTAGKIINGRPYGSIEELLTKKSVGKATFEKIKDLVGL